MARKYYKKKSNGLRTLLIIIAALSMIVLVGVLVINVWFDNLIGGMKRVNESAQETMNSDELLQHIGDTTDKTPVQQQAESIIAGKDVVNILLVGQDRREGEPRMHSDAMILCTINTKSKTLTMTSFMRDLWVYIPEHYNQRLNVPYMVGGFPLLNDTLEYNFGVRADYNFEIDFNGFMQAIDIIGGLDIELTAAEARYLNNRGNWDIEENQGWQLVEGINHMTGSQALAYSRIREIGDDFERTERQRIVLNLLIEKAKTLSAGELYDLVSAVIPMLTTDMTNSEIRGLTLDFVPMISGISVVSQRIPADGEFYFANKNGASVIAMSDESLKTNIELLTKAMENE